MDIALAIAAIGLLVFLAHLFTAVFEQTRLPDVLWLILIGLLLGPLLGFVEPEDFGAVGGVVTTITLIILLFEEGVGLSLTVLRQAARGTLGLTLTGFAATAGAVGACALALTDLDPVAALMLGAIVGSTSPAVVIPLVKQLRMGEESRTILFLESAASDVLSIVVAIALVELHRLGELRVGLMVGEILSSFVLASLLGIGSGFLWSMLLDKVRNLKHAVFTTPAFLFVVFGVTELLGFSGYIAALAFGVTLGNIEAVELPRLKQLTPLVPLTFNDTERVFFAEVAFLLKTFFFVYVGLSVHLTDVGVVSVAGALTLAIYLMRVPVVRLTVRRTTPVGDASLMAVMAPKGLAAVVLSAMPLQAGIPGGD
jgi:cell volume regulation protein A